MQVVSSPEVDMKAYEEAEKIEGICYICGRQSPKDLRGP